MQRVDAAPVDGVLTKPLVLLAQPTRPEGIRQVLVKAASLTTLVLGCGRRPIAGAINQDHAYHSDHVDVAWDLDTTPWPVPADRFRRIIATDVFEHLKSDVVDWMRECWRILTPPADGKLGGELVLRVSAWDNPVSYRDPTHHRVFTEESFHYFWPGHPLYHEYGTVYYGTECPTFEVVTVGRGNADPRWPDRGDICAVLRKVARP